MLSQRQQKRQNRDKRRKDKDRKKKKTPPPAVQAANKRLMPGGGSGGGHGIPRPALGKDARTERLVLKRSAKEVIFEVLDLLDQHQARRSAPPAPSCTSTAISAAGRPSGLPNPPAAAASAATAAHNKMWTREDVVKLEKRRAKQERDIQRQIKADKKQAKKTKEAKERAKRRAVDPNSKNVRISLTTAHKSGEKKTLVVARKDDLADLLRTAKNKFNKKPNKLKKPARCFLVEPASGLVEEVHETQTMCDGDLIMVTEKGQIPDGFADDNAAAAAAVAAAPDRSPATPLTTPGEAKADDASSAAVPAVADKNVSKVQRLRAAYMRRCRHESDSSAWSKKANVDAIQAEQAWLASRAEVSRDKPQFQEMQAVRSGLPCHQHRDEILRAVVNHPVVVISGETGCGKTTQIPQFVLEHALSCGDGGACSIICTQPRRISAIGVATRVAAERAEQVGDVVGYQIRLEKRTSRHTHLTFCTTGILLRRLTGDPDLRGISHVILDEVHEREVLSDFLLILLRDLVRSRRPDLKIVLMSATINAELFSDYFATDTSPCPCLHIPGRTFPVERRSLEDIVEQLRYHAVPSELQRNVGRGSGGNGGGTMHSGRENSKKYSTATLRVLDIVDESKINYELIVQLVEHICRGGADLRQVESAGVGAVLIFMPGLGEITRMCKMLRERASIMGGGGRSGGGHGSAMVLPLHGSLTSREQTRVFSRAPHGVRKIVVSTNIAETSVTIDDVVYVIDTGRVKEIQYNEISNCPALVETWCSKASARQRQGRAGRVRPGLCFQMFSLRQESEGMLDFQIPEIRRKPLEDLILQIRLLQLDSGISPSEFLRRALEPPAESAIKTALKSLRDMGAIGEGSSVTSTELTPLGFHLANLPVGAKLGKLLLFGCLFRCIEPVLTIAAAMSCRSPFVSPLNKREDAKECKLVFSQHQSDLLTIARAFDCWNTCHKALRSTAKKTSQQQQQEQHQQQRHVAPYTDSRQFSHDYYISEPGMVMIANMRRQFRRQLRSIGFLRSETTDDGPGGNGNGVGSKLSMTSIWANETLSGECNGNGRDVGILRCVLCASLYPNVARVRRVDSRGGTRKRFDRYTTQTEEVHVHPGSINFERNALKGESWLVYNEKQMTSRMYMYDTNVVTPYMLFLFGGEILFDYTKEIISVDSWIEFQSTAECFTLFKRLRSEIQRTLALRIEDPTSKTTSTDEQILVEAVSTLLASERPD